MKHKKVIQVIAENYEEEQFMLNRFPEAWWDDRSGRMVFSISEDKEFEVQQAINEYKERVKNETQ